MNYKEDITTYLLIN